MAKRPARSASLYHRKTSRKPSKNKKFNEKKAREWMMMNMSKIINKDGTVDPTRLAVEYAKSEGQEIWLHSTKGGRIFDVAFEIGSQCQMKLF